ncbi:MAG: thioredoxin family protein, partial [Novipirellula sp. JB048]
MKIMFAIAVALITVTQGVHGAAASASGSILIEFSSTHCPPCRAMQPVIGQLEQAGVPVRRVDVDSERDLARRYGIRQTPTFVVVAAGNEVTRLVGTQSLAQLREALAIHPGGPLIPTGSMSPARNGLPAPQTRLAPVGRLPVGETLASRTAVAPTAAITPAIEPMPSLSKADAIERARAATVRLRVHDGKGYGAGTGTIIDT